MARSTRNHSEFLGVQGHHLNPKSIRDRYERVHRNLRGHHQMRSFQLLLVDAFPEFCRVNGKLHVFGYDHQACHYDYLGGLDRGSYPTLHS